MIGADADDVDVDADGGSLNNDEVDGALLSKAVN
jgi:hypothetical protein